MKQSIGMIGIGLMGHGIAYNIARAGYTLTVLDHAGNQPLDELLDMGVKVEKTIAGLTKQANILILCVTGAPQVEEIITAENGIVTSMQKGCIVIDCSTSLPETSRSVAEKITKAGGHFIDAAMTRLPAHARAGTLNLLVGGEAEDLERVQELLKTFSENITHIGKVGTGHLMKLLHNYVSISMVALLGEVSAHAAKAGIEYELLIDVLSKGGGGGIALQRISPYLLTGDAQNMAFTIANAAKDLSYYHTTASALGTYSQIAKSVVDTLQSLEKNGHGKNYLPELASLLRTLET